MAAALALLGAGAAILYVGAEASVRGATALARAAGIPMFAMGALLFGIDFEGLGAALVAAGRGQTEIAAGESFGTVLFLFAAAFGVALIVSRKPVPAPAPLMIAAPAVAVIAAASILWDRHVSRPEGTLLLLLYVAYVYLVVQEGRAAKARARELEEEARELGDLPVAAPRPRLVSGIVTTAGLGLVYLGAVLLVAGGSRFVDLTGLAAGFVGAAIIGALVSLDEVLLEVLPIRRGTPELATGNLFGTLAAFTTGVLGLAALVRPLDLDGAANITFLAAVFLYAVVGTTFLVRGKAGSGLGVFVLSFYAGWLILASAV